MAAKRGRGSIVLRGDGIYQGQISLGYHEDGTRNRPTVYGRTVQEVEEKIVELRRKARRGEIRKAEPLTVHTFLEAWLQSRKTRKTSKQLRESSADLYAGLIKNHIRPHIGEKRLDRLKWQDVDALYQRLRELGASDSTLKKVHVLLHAAMSDAAKADKIVRNPMDHVDSPTYKPPEMQTLTPEEGEQLLLAAKEDGKFYALYLLALDTGMRQGELFGLKRADIDLKNRTVAVRRSGMYQ